MQRNFEPMRKQVEAWQKSELTDVTAKVVKIPRLERSFLSKKSLRLTPWSFITRTVRTRLIYVTSPCGK
jgi:hypothetical protein